MPQTATRNPGVDTVPAYPGMFMYLQRLLMHNDTVARMEPFDFAQDRLREIRESCLQ